MSELPTPVTPAEEAKSRGNEAFNAKNYDDAITHYSEAIRLNPDCAVYYSNRSASYASKLNWQAAFEDAETCVAKDATFVKGYLRLATAQIALGFFDEAETTLKSAESYEPENAAIPKLKRDAKKAKQEYLKSQQKTKQLDEGQYKELASIKEQLGVLQKDLFSVNSRIESNGREFRITQTTAGQVNKAPEESNMFRAVGKAYLKETKPEILTRLSADSNTLDRSSKDLTDRKQYLERRITELFAHRNDIISAK